MVSGRRALLFGIAFCVVAALILDFGVLPPPYIVSSPSPIDFTARVPFTYNDPDELTILREDAANRAFHVYVEEEDWPEKILSDLDKLVAIAERAESEADAREKTTANGFHKTSVRSWAKCIGKKVRAD